ncbi:hypothetical protein [Lentzea sp. NPDC059081]|uniref:hypothetical protein n=1 Tax=Lentzea sp. NPDC059081 TaxID=3346719 RepID=UPI0036CECEC6
MTHWQESGQVTGKVLDAGFNAGWLAGQGHDVTGFGVSPTAVAIARGRRDRQPHLGAAAHAVQDDRLSREVVDERRS